MRYRCPYPGCKHTGEIITKYHVKTEHEMERDDLYEKHGKHKMVQMDPKKLRNNMKNYLPYKPH